MRGERTGERREPIELFLTESLIYDVEAASSRLLAGIYHINLLRRGVFLAEVFFFFFINCQHGRHFTPTAHIQTSARMPLQPPQNKSASPSCSSFFRSSNSFSSLGSRPPMEGRSNSEFTKVLEGKKKKNPDSGDAPPTPTSFLILTRPSITAPFSHPSSPSPDALPPPRRHQADGILMSSGVRKGQ